VAITVVCNCGKSLRAPDKLAGRPARCPNCRALITVPVPSSQVETSIRITSEETKSVNSPSGQSPAVPLAEVMRANRRLAGRKCPICGATIALGDDVRNCTECGQSYHVDCWNENDGCATYACQSSPQPAPPMPPAAKPDAPASPPTPRQRPLRVGRILVIIVVALVLAAVSVWAVNYVQLQQPMNEVLIQDHRNHGIRVSCHYEGWLNAGVLVYDLRKVPYNKAPADVFRVFLQYAEKLSHRDFSQVRLSYQGHVKFLLPGRHFREVGRDYGTENVLYTIRTFPEKLANPDGTRAFPEWTGGVLGVLKEQMEDFSSFNQRWYGASGIQ